MLLTRLSRWAHPLSRDGLEARGAVSPSNLTVMVLILIVFLSFLLLVAYLKDIALEHHLPAAEAPAAGSCDQPLVVEGEQHHEKPLPSLPSRLPPPAVVVIIDGTWSQAKQILSRYPSLSPRRPSGMGPGTRGVRSPIEFSAEPERDIVEEEVAQEALCRAVMFRSAGPSGYGFRREPSRECISTLESVAYSLEVYSDSSAVYPSLL